MIKMKMANNSTISKRINYTKSERWLNKYMQWCTCLKKLKCLNEQKNYMLDIQEYMHFNTLPPVTTAGSYRTFFRIVSYRIFGSHWSQNSPFYGWLTIASASWSGVCMVWKSGLLTSAPIPTSVRIRVTSLHRTASSTGNMYTVRGQFHKTKKFVITKIMFVITNVSNFVFSISTVC